MTFDFDTPVVRRGSGSYKWDGHGIDADTLPMWVADMDFRCAPAIIDALRRRVDHAVFGYTQVPDSYYEALTRWFATRHGLRFGAGDVIYTSGVVPAISAIIKALCRPGDGVIVQTPVYNCFFSSIRNNGCRIADAPLQRVDCGDGTFTYRPDYDALEREAARTDTTLMLLCNPHNPAGRTWSADELQQMLDICRRNGVRVVSDEIHCELTAPGHKFTSAGTLDDDVIICNSPSKAFNTAGLQIANIIARNDDDRRRIDRAININEVCDVNPFGVTALIAAYNEGAPWLEALRAYINDNYQCLCDFFSNRLPGLPVCRMEATYLVWVDISSLGTGADDLERRILDEGHLLVNSGTMYGCDGYIRINIACPRAVMLDGLQRLASVIGDK